MANDAFDYWARIFLRLAQKPCTVESLSEDFESCDEMWPDQQEEWCVNCLAREFLKSVREALL